MSRRSSSSAESSIDDMPGGGGGLPRFSSFETERFFGPLNEIDTIAEDYRMAYLHWRLLCIRICQDLEKSAPDAAPSSSTEVSTKANKNYSTTTTSRKSLPAFAKKTPLSLLHEICSQANSTITIPHEEQISLSKQSHQSFHCKIVVTTKLNKIYEGTGIGRSKQLARHAAARMVLTSISPETEDHILPEYLVSSSEDPDDYDDRCANVVDSSSDDQFDDYDFHNHNGYDDDYDDVGLDGDVNVVVSPPGSGSIDGVVGSGSQETLSPASSAGRNINAGEVSVARKDNRLVITVNLPQGESLMTAPQSVPQDAVMEHIDTIKHWTGPLIEKLKGCSVARIRTIVNPVLVAKKISGEQNLTLKFYHLNEEGNVQEDFRASCIMEVTRSSSSSLITTPPIPAPFTVFGYGKSGEEAEAAASRNFLMQMRMILNSNLCH